MNVIYSIQGTAYTKYMTLEPNVYFLSGVFNYYDDVSAFLYVSNRLFFVYDDVI